MIYANPFIILVIVAALPIRSGSPCSFDPALTALFTPARSELGRYEVCTTDQPLEGDAEALEAPDAFGAAGSYDRAALQRLYNGARVRVQRSWTRSADGFVSTTRLSPYPDASLTRLRPGTMEIRWTWSR